MTSSQALAPLATEGEENAHHCIIIPSCPAFKPIPITREWPCRTHRVNLRGDFPYWGHVSSCPTSHAFRMINGSRLLYFIGSVPLDIIRLCSIYCTVQYTRFRACLYRTQLCLRFNSANIVGFVLVWTTRLCAHTLICCHKRIHLHRSMSAKITAPIYTYVDRYSKAYIIISMNIIA